MVATVATILSTKITPIPLTGGAGDDTITLGMIVLSGALSRYRIYVRTVPVGAGAVFTSKQ